VNLIVFLTWDYSLKTWAEAGTLDRELKLFKKLANNYDTSVTFFTYGDDSDISYIEKYPEFDIIPIYKYFKYEKSKLLRFIKSFLFPFYLKKICKNIEIVYQNQLLGSWIAIIFKIINKIPLLIRTGYDMHQFAIHDKKTKIITKLYKSLTYLSLVFCDKYSVTSKSDFDLLIRTFPKYKNKILIRPNWVDIDKNEKFESRITNRILSVGRLVYQKNYKYLITEFKNTNTYFEIDIVGSGTELSNLKNLALKNNVKVNFLGNLSYEDLIQLYSEYKYFVSTSVFEGNPKSLIEAMGSGCVVFASNIENHKELIDDDLDGFLYKLKKGELINKFNLKTNDETKLKLVSSNSFNKIKRNNSFDLLLKNTCEDLEKLAF